MHIRVHVVPRDAYMCTRGTRGGEKIGFPVTGVADNCEPPHGCWDLNPDPLPEQQLPPMQQKDLLPQFPAGEFLKMQTVPQVWAGSQQEWRETGGLHRSYREAFTTAFPAGQTCVTPWSPRTGEGHPCTTRQVTQKHNSFARHVSLTKSLQKIPGSWRRGGDTVLCKKTCTVMQKC